MNSITIKVIDTPIGELCVGATDAGICLVDFADGKKLNINLQKLSNSVKATVSSGDHPHLDALQQQLIEYFDGKRRVFKLPLTLCGTEFELQTWASLMNIPYGATCSYKEQAETLGHPRAVRAIASANGRNRISIIIPCHRVIGSDGGLGGYGGGVHRKKILLELEAKNKA